nr:RecName: Full=Unknown protein 3 [Daucus carota]
CSVVDLAR